MCIVACMIHMIHGYIYYDMCDASCIYMYIHIYLRLQLYACWYMYTGTCAYLIVQVHEGENVITKWKTRYGPPVFCIIFKRHPSLYILYLMTFTQTMQGNQCYVIIEILFFGTVGHWLSHFLRVKD